MAAKWGVQRQEKIDGRWKDRKLDLLARDLEAAVLHAAQEWRKGVDNLATSEALGSSTFSGASCSGQECRSVR